MAQTTPAASDPLADSKSRIACHNDALP